MKIAGWVLSGLIALFLAVASAAPKFMGMEAATSAMEVVGWPVKYLVLIGCIEVGCMILFLTELCTLLEVEPPQPASAEHQQNDYVFERAVSFREAADKVGHGRKDYQPQRRHFGFARMLEIVQIGIDRG